MALHPAHQISLNQSFIFVLQEIYLLHSFSCAKRVERTMPIYFLISNHIKSHNREEGKHLGKYLLAASNERKTNGKKNDQNFFPAWNVSSDASSTEDHLSFLNTTEYFRHPSNISKTQGLRFKQCADFTSKT